ncbi:MAG: hypothetical protein IT379_30455 [Deltaproteobacteria bacterium]|nr:hypothetical protein [Deltaproteobacteria bacterium]
MSSSARGSLRAGRSRTPAERFGFTRSDSQLGARLDLGTDIDTIEISEAPMQIGDFRTENFNVLPSLHEAGRNLERHRGALEKLGQVIARHGLKDAVGIALLHRHFELAPGEHLVERIDTAARESVIVPTRDGAGMHPHLLAFMGGQWSPLEFVTDSYQAANGTEQLRHIPAFLREYADTLAAEGVASVFGISVFHNRDDLLDVDREVLVESTEVATRTSRMRPDSRDAVARMDVTETLWLWDGKTCRMGCVCVYPPNQPNNHGHVHQN